MSINSACCRLLLVLAGTVFSSSLSTAQQVFAWGLNDYGQSTVPAVTGEVRQVAAGYSFTLARRADGTVLEWGDTRFGLNSVPATLTGVVKIDAGRFHGIALKSNGTVVCWGDSSNNQNVSPSGSDYVDIAAGYEHNLAIKSNGTVVGWGRNIEGQCNPPAGLTNVVAVSGGYYHSLALKADGTVVAWGMGYSGENIVPAGLNNVVAIKAAATISLAVKGDGTVVAWGYNGQGQCNVPAGLTGVVEVASEGYHVIARKSDETLVTWGWNDQGQCDIPSGLGGVTGIAAGFKHSVALRVRTIKTTMSPASVVGGSTKALTGKVTINVAQAAPFVVDLASNSASVTVPPSVTIPAGKLFATFNATHTIVPVDQTYTITGTSPRSNTSPVTANILAFRGTPFFDYETIEGGRPLTLFVRLNAFPTTPLTAHVTSDNPSKLGMTAAGFDLHFAAGEQIRYASLSTDIVAVNTRVGVTSTVGSLGQSSSVLLVPKPKLESVTLSGSIYGNQILTGTITLKTAAPVGGATIQLSSTDASLAVPATVTVPAGGLSTNFTVQAADVTSTLSATVTAASGYSVIGKTMSVRPLTVSSVALDPQTLQGGGSSTGTVTLNVTVQVDTVVSLSSGKPSIASVPATMIIPAGSNSGTFTILTSTVTSIQSATITASKNGTSRSKSLTMTP